MKNQFVEAQVMQQFAQSQGVPASAIFAEGQSRNTIQNAYYSYKIMQAHDWNSALVVSSPSHLRRASLIFSHYPLAWQMHAAPWPADFPLWKLVWFWCSETGYTSYGRIFGFPNARKISAPYSVHIAQALKKSPFMPKLSGFQFKRPQQLAALLLLLLVAQCLWVFHRQTLTSRDYDFARCGREMWEKPNPLAGYFTTCGNIPDGTLGYRVAGLPLTLQRIVAGQSAGHFHLGDAPRARLRPAAAAQRLPAHGSLAGGRAVVGNAASLWQSRRLYRAGLLLLFSCGHSRLYLSQQRNSRPRLDCSPRFIQRWG